MAKDFMMLRLALVAVLTIAALVVFPLLGRLAGMLDRRHAPVRRARQIRRRELRLS